MVTDHTSTESQSITDILSEASQAARKGHFRIARQLVTQHLGQASDLDRVRLRAFLKGFSVDSAAWVVLGVTLMVLSIIIAFTLFH